jgi:hypothetical protein
MRKRDLFKPTTSFRQKLAFISFGLVLTLVLLEAGLRCARAVFSIRGFYNLSFLLHLGVIALVTAQLRFFGFLVSVCSDLPNVVKNYFLTPH